jgi:hypothetical protein
MIHCTLILIELEIISELKFEIISITDQDLINSCYAGYIVHIL